MLAGAFGAHGLQDRVGADGVSAWSTGVHYHLLHSVVILGLGLFRDATQRSIELPAVLFALGILLFSGSLYGLVLTQQSWLGPVTPIGGALLVAGWLSMLRM